MDLTCITVALFGNLITPGFYFITLQFIIFTLDSFLPLLIETTSVLCSASNSLDFFHEEFSSYIASFAQISIWSKRFATIVILISLSHGG